MMAFNLSHSLIVPEVLYNNVLFITVRVAKVNTPGFPWGEFYATEYKPYCPVQVQARQTSKCNTAQTSSAHTGISSTPSTSLLRMR